MSRRRLLILGIVVAPAVIGAAAGGVLYLLCPVQISTIAGMTRNYFISPSAPPGAATTELNSAYKAPEAAAPANVAAPTPNATSADRPGYNRTLTSDRYSQLDQINPKNVGKLKVLCTYDVDEYTAFESGLIVVDGALVGATQYDIFSLNPATCALNWRTHEDYPPALLPANRGAACMDSMLFHGTGDGRAVAYQFKTGNRIWKQTIADPKHGESVPGGNPAPDFVIGVREGDNSFSDSVVVLDPKTRNYRNQFQIVKKDRRDRDVSNPPILIQTRGGKQLMTVAPKDGNLYGYDLATNNPLCRVPATTIKDITTSFEPGKDVFFCPGPTGGAEWSSPSYDPRTNLIMIGEVDWCDTATLQTPEKLQSIAIEQPWVGMATFNPFNMFGKESRTESHWAGWIYAADADTGVWKRRLKSNCPIIGAMTPTAGGVVSFGDAGVLGTIRVVVMLANIRGSAAAFAKGKTWVILACLSATLIWGIAFMVVAGDWFLAREASTAALGTQLGAMIYFLPCALALIVAMIHHEEPEA